MPFSARALKKSIFFDVDIVVKNKSKCGFSWYVLLSITSTRHYSLPKLFFELFLHIKRVCKSFWKSLTRTSSSFAAPRESTTFWPLWWRVSLSIKLYTTLNHIRFVNLKLLLMLALFWETDLHCMHEVIAHSWLLASPSEAAIYSL